MSVRYIRVAGIMVTAPFCLFGEVEVQLKAVIHVGGAQWRVSLPEHVCL